jgi:hypothetical protein
VADKNAANFCEYFEFKKRVWAGKATEAGEEGRANTARDQLKKLLGD